MKSRLGMAVLAATLLATGAASGGERTVTLEVENMWCASCPYIVRKTLANVAGVSDVAVSFEKKTAVVTFEDERTSVAALTAATTEIGFPSRVIE